MVAKKRKSKRQTLQQKFRIIKNVREHKKKLKKGVLTNGQLARIKAKRNKAENNKIPNAWPYKEDLLKELNEAKEKMEAQRQRQKDKRNEELVSRITWLSWKSCLTSYTYLDEEKNAKLFYGSRRRK